MKNKKPRRQKGYVLVISIIVILVISTIMIGCVTVVYKYNAMLEKEKIELREEVK